MIAYYEELSQEEQKQVTDVIRSLLSQTFLLERKLDRRTGRFQNNREFYTCNKHLEFIRDYFAVCGIAVSENTQMGVIYIEGEHVLGEKLSKLATLYLLILKVIYEEQMSTVSTSVNVFTTLGEVNEKLGAYRLLKNRPSVTEIRKTLSLLKRYQIIEALDVLEELDHESRFVIYPCINVVLMGEDVRAILDSLGEEETQEDQEKERNHGDGVREEEQDDECEPEL